MSGGYAPSYSAYQRTRFGCAIAVVIGISGLSAAEPLVATDERGASRFPSSSEAGASQPDRKFRSSTGPCGEEAPPRGWSFWSRACSFRHPLCVCGSPGSNGRELTDVVTAADRAWETLVGVIGVPQPERGIDGHWNLYLGDVVDGGGQADLVALDPRARFDRGSSFGRIDRAASGCVLDLAVARAVAQGSLLASAPTTAKGLGLAESDELARLATPCAAFDDDDVAFQSHPERTLVDGLSTPFARGGAAFFEWLDSRFGRQPGAMVPALWALTPSRSDVRAASDCSGATVFDVLAASLRGAFASDATLDEVFVGFAMARAAMWPPVLPAWDVSWPVRPRRLVSPRPVSPTGASYVVIHREGAVSGTRLRLEAEWEDYARMQWVVLKLDSGGETLAQIRISSPDRATRAALTLDAIDGIDRVVVVGVNVGSTEHAFSPAQGEWEPHGWMLTIQALAP